MTTEDRPKRIQLKRVSGWRPARPTTRSCARPHLFGNPFKIGTYEGLVREPAADMVTPWEYEGRVSADGTQHDMHWPGGDITRHRVRYMTRAESVATHRRALIAPTTSLRLHHRPRTGPAVYITVDLVRERLAGLDLGCWCDHFGPCHADTLLWVANADEVEIKEAAEREYEILKASAERVAALHPEVLCAAR